MEQLNNNEAAQRDGPNPEALPERQATATGRLGRLAIYAASLLDYNNGILHGAWVDADDDESRMATEVYTMLAKSPTTKQYGEPAEEWAIHDYEGFEPYRLDEYSGLATVARLAGGIREHGPAFAAWAAWHGNTDEETLNKFEDAYLGQWHSAEDYAEHLLDEFGISETLDTHITDGLRPYVKIDAAGFARDLELSGELATMPAEDGDVYVFDVTG